MPNSPNTQNVRLQFSNDNGTSFLSGLGFPMLSLSLFQDIGLLFSTSPLYTLIAYAYIVSPSQTFIYHFQCRVSFERLHWPLGLSLKGHFTLRNYLWKTTLPCRTIFKRLLCHIELFFETLRCPVELSFKGHFALQNYLWKTSTFCNKSN